MLNVPLVMVSVRSDDWPITTVDGPKALVSVVPTTTKVSLILGAVSPPCSEPDGILLVAAVGEVVGKTTTDDLLDSIFRQFCLGK